MDGVVGVSAERAMSVPKAAGRAYVGRIVHIDWDVVHTLIGKASHLAYLILAKKYKTIRLRGHFDEHKRLTGDIMRAWCWELAEKKIEERLSMFGH